MEWIIGIVTLFLGFSLDRIWEWYKRKQAGLSGHAHDIVQALGRDVQPFNGYHYLSNSPTDNYKVAKHIYECATGEIIGTCFRENPAGYGEQDLARLLPTGAFFSRITNDAVFPPQNRINAEATLKELVPNSKIVIVPSKKYFTSIDGIYCEFPDGTNIAFITFPDMGTNQKNSGIVFYGHIAKTLFNYYKDLGDAHKEEAKGG